MEDIKMKDLKAPFGFWKIWWKEKIWKSYFFSCVWFRENHKEKNMEEI